MRAVSLVLLAAVFAAYAAANVVDATDATFDDIVKNNQFVIMEFYAPWCGHCKKLAPEYAEAAKKLEGKAVLAQLDATVEKAQAEKFQIKGFPTLKIFRDGELAGDYEGGRTAADIVNYVKANSGPAVRPLTTTEAIDELKKENKVAVIAFTSSGNAGLLETFETVAKQLRNTFAFGLVTDESFFDGSDNSIVLYKQFDDHRVVFSGDQSSAEELSKFIREEGTPLFDEIGPQNYKGYIERKLPIVWLFTTAKDTAANEAGKGASSSFKGRMSWVWIDHEKYGGMAQRLGLKGDKWPALAIDFDGAHFAFPADKEMTVDSLRQFANDYLEGKLVQSVRSEEKPAEHTVNGLTTVVGDTFKELVEAADQDVFIEFYAPWCGHCKSLAPTYEKVAEALKDEPVRVAKIDATANDFNQKMFPVQGFPTIFYVKKGSGEAKTYEGGRTEDDMVSFVKAQLAK